MRPGCVGPALRTRSAAALGKLKTRGVSQHGGRTAARVGTTCLSLAMTAARLQRRSFSRTAPPCPKL